MTRRLIVLILLLILGLSLLAAYQLGQGLTVERVAATLAGLVIVSPVVALFWVAVSAPSHTSTRTHDDLWEDL
jgi:hypothetical protein